MPFSIEPLVEIQKDLTPPDGQAFWTRPQPYGERPVFTAQQMAATFFARRRLWIVTHLLSGDHMLDGKLIEIPRTPSGDRRFQLYHVELIAHAFLAKGIIDLRTFSNCITIIRAISSNYKLFT